MFTDRNTGMYDVNAAKNWFNGVKKSTKEEDVRMVVDQLIKPVEINLLTQKYVSLFTQASYVPKWMLEKMNADNAMIASVDFAGGPYTSIPDASNFEKFKNGFAVDPFTSQDIFYSSAAAWSERRWGWWNAWFNGYKYMEPSFNKLQRELNCKCC